MAKPRAIALGDTHVAIEWSDGHTTGIYPYDYLLERCECDACVAKRK